MEKTDTQSSSDNTSIPKKSSATSITIIFFLRILTFVFLLIALIFMAINTQTNEFTGDEVKFDSIYAYRFMFSAIVIGSAYNLLQMAFSVFTVISGSRVINNKIGYLFDFFGDKIMSYLLLSGSAAGLAFTLELKRDEPSDPFTAKAIISASLLLVGFWFTAIASIFTSFALPKKATN